MSNVKRITIDVTGIRRLNNSPDGNPRFHVRTDVRPPFLGLYTAPDSADAYKLSGWEHINARLDVLLDERYRITHIFSITEL